MVRVLRSGVERLEWRHNTCIMRSERSLIDSVKLKERKDLRKK